MKRSIFQSWGLCIFDTYRVLSVVNAAGINSGTPTGPGGSARRSPGPRRAPRPSVTPLPPPASAGVPADRLCQHAGICINAGNSHHCQCPLGYTGSYCEEQLDECSSNPCQHGATCSDFVGGYRCEVSTAADRGHLPGAAPEPWIPLLASRFLEIDTFFFFPPVAVTAFTNHRFSVPLRD